MNKSIRATRTLIVVLALAFCMSPRWAAAEVSWRSYRLVELPGGVGEAINDNGVIIGGARYWSVDADGTVLRTGSLVPPPGFLNSDVAARSINNSGDAVGRVSWKEGGGADRAEAVMWQGVGTDGLTARALPAPHAPPTEPYGLYWTQANGISDSGLIVGESYATYVDPESWQTTVYWHSVVVWQPDPSSQGGFHFFEIPTGGLYVEAYAVNSSGQVLGWVDGLGVVVWQLTFDADDKVNGVRAPIPVEGGFDCLRIDDGGAICGGLYSGDAALWTLTYDAQDNPTGVGAPTIVGVPDRTDYVIRLDLSRCGTDGAIQVVGTGQEYVGTKGKQPTIKPFLWEDGVMVDPNDLVADDGGFSSIRVASRINGAGWILGDGYKDGVYSGFVALPVATQPMPGITVSPTDGLITTEEGVTDTFTIVLDTQPAADVTIGLSSSDTTEGTVSPASVTFTPADWDQPQTVTVTGQDDLDVDGDIEYSIITAAAVSADPAYSGLDAADVAVLNLDNEAQPQPTTCSVASIGHGTAGPKGRDLLITVTVVDDFAQPVAGASVSIEVSLDGASYANPTGVTGDDGTVTFKIRNAPSGTYTVRVTSVIAAGLDWDGDPCETTFEK